jgi:serine/threonine protein kinase/regulation of enolase protein 1 (concanavalin A-like superfamily)
MLTHLCMPATPTPAILPQNLSSLDLPASSLLQACPNCEALIDTTEREPLETVSCPGCGAPLEINGSIGGLQLVEVAGRGGMGVVFKAYDPGLDRYIAIKLLRKDHSSDRNLIEQLENEAMITASVNDANVVKVYSTGLDRGRFYLAMELVDKGSLDDLIQLQGRVAEAQALEVGIQIASGLRAAFRHGLVHRDVKPGNILFGDSRTAKIVDFGLATFMSQIEDCSGEIWGTPYYIPPEKLDGGVEDCRSDIYSLGASLFHALAGRPPFEGASATLVALKHVKSQVVRLQAFAPWVSNSTAHIVNRTLAKNPADRFQSYDDLIHNFEYALDELQKGGGKAPNRARVVLETEDDRKTWTWVVVGMAAVIMVLIGVFALGRPKADKTTAIAKPVPRPVITPSNGSKLINEVKALGSLDDKAASLLEAAANQRQNSPIDLAWARLLAGTAYLVSDRTAEARTAFEKIDSLAAEIKDPELATFLRNVSVRLITSEVIPPVEAQGFNKNTYEAIGYLLYGLHNWQVGALEDGTALMKQFRSSPITGSAEWLGNLKPIATEFAGKLESFQMAVDKLKAAKNGGERDAAAKEFQALGPTFAKRVDSAINPFAKELADYRKSLTAIPAPGVYRIVNKHSKLAIDVEGHHQNEGAKVHQWEATGGANQLWELIPVGGDTFKFRAVHSGLVLNVPNSSTQPGTRMWQWKDDGTSAGLWRIEPKGDGWFFIRSVSSDQVLAVENMNTSNGGPLTQWDRPGTDDHLWRFEPLGSRIGAWGVLDIGGFRQPADTAIDGSTISLAVNNDDIWNERDSCRFIYQEVIGDFDFVAQLAEMSDVADWTKTGIMVRNSLFESSRNLLFGFSGRRGVILQRRTTENTATTQEPAVDELKGPGWIKVSRRGSSFECFHSRDGKEWKEVARQQMDIMNEAVVGLAGSSWNTGERFSARFENVSLTKP